MRWLDKLEKHFGFLAVPHLGVSLVAAQALATLLALKDPGVPAAMVLDPAQVAAGEWWRLFSYLVVPSLSPFSLAFAIFWFYFFWFMAGSLELEWGRFRLTVYVLLGWALPVVLAMAAWQLLGLRLVFTGWHFATSIQLAFAFLAPEFTIYLFMILPIKMRWWAWFIGILFAFQVISGGITELAVVLAGVGNYLVFFLPAYWRGHALRRQANEGKRVFAAARREVERVQARHCAQCGRGPEADLRLCTCARCGEEGRQWCFDHVQAHLQDPGPPKEMGDPAPAKKKKRKG